MGACKMSKFLECTYCQNTYFWAESCRCPIHVYYDIVEDQLFLSNTSKANLKNLVYLGSL